MPRACPPTSASTRRTPAPAPTPVRVVARVVVGVVVTLGFVAALEAGGFAGPSPAAAAMGSSGPQRAVPVPSGWRTYAYADALVAAPAGWAVERDAPCAWSRGRGLLVLGVPQGVAYSCPAFLGAPWMVEVTVAANPVVGAGPRGPAERVGALTVVALRAAAPWTRWWVPSLGLVVTGAGAQSAEVMRTLQPLVPHPLEARCQSAALAADLPWVDQRLGVTSWAPFRPLLDWSAAPPVPPTGFAATYPQFASLVDTGLEAFATLTGAPAAAAFYRATLDPSRRLTLRAKGCTGVVAGVETLEGSVSPRVFGPPWDMVAVLVPGAPSGEVFLRGDCPGGVPPATTTARCDTVAVDAPTGAPTPAWITVSSSIAGSSAPTG